MILPYKKASALADNLPEPTWLVEGLWSDGAVGILGGEPKCCKSFLALELAVAVSSGRPCLGRYQVQKPGPVLLFAAEDSHQIVKARLNGIAMARNVSLHDLDIQVITAERLRLDQSEDTSALEQTVATVQPRLLILDPFVRLHRIDENSSTEVAAILEKMRLIQRRYGTAILIVHHAKKNGGATRAGQALRGSSEFHAWGDSNLYMRRGLENLTLTMEHRAAPSTSGIPLALREGLEGALALEPCNQGDQTSANDPKPSKEERIQRVLAHATAPLKLADLRRASGLRTGTLCQTVKAMVESGRVERTNGGYTLLSP